MRRILMAAAALALAGCGTPAERALSEESSSNDVLARVVADTSLTAAMLDRMAQDPRAGRTLADRAVHDPVLWGLVLERVAADRQLVDQLVARAMRDEANKAYLMGLIRGIGAAPAAGAP